MTGLSLTLRVTGTLSAAVILALAIAAQRSKEGIPSGNYRDAQRAQDQERVLQSIRLANETARFDWLSPDARAAVCGRFEQAWLPLRCGERLLALSDAVASADAALRSLGPPRAGRRNHALSAVYAVDVKRLLEMVRNGALGAPAAARELRLLAARSFGGIAWREQAPSRAQQAKFAAGTLARVGSSTTARPNPWAPFPGCAYMRKGRDGTPGLLLHDPSQLHCLKINEQAAAAADPFAAPPGWSSVAQSLVAAANAGLAAGGPNSVTVLGDRVPQGAHALSSILAREQKIAQAVALCMTGRADVCKDLEIADEAWRTRYESAAVRRIGILLVDIATGNIEAAASAHTACYEQQHDGPGAAAACPTLPQKPARRDALLVNHALFAQAMPGSLVKPVTATALLADPAYASYLLGPGARQLQLDIAQSNSKVFHDRLFCAEKDFANCVRPALFARAATMLGWNEGCADAGTLPCAATDLATGASAASALPGFLGRAGIREQARSDGGWEPIPSAFTADWASRCRTASWSKCKGGSGSAVDLLADAWGQGNARATPPGIARMLGTLGAAANGQARAGSPHLLHATLPATVPLRAAERAVLAPRRHAELIVSGMVLGHRKGGTSASACAAAADAATCDRIAWIAGKTATPVFNHDRFTLAERLQLCGHVLERAHSSAAERELAFHCGAAPVKWYAALVKSTRDPGAKWDKALVVIAERNWDRATGLVDSPGDTGVNIAARAAFETLFRIF